jgi:hypothetical protein
MISVRTVKTVMLWLVIVGFFTYFSNISLCQTLLPTGIEVSKTAEFDGRFVTGKITITNGEENPAVITTIGDSLEVHFPG